MTNRKCQQCRAVLRQGNTSNLCSLCLKKKREQESHTGEIIIDAQQYAERRGLKSAESIKRLARKNKLAPRIPDIRKYQWWLTDVEAHEKNRQLQEALTHELTNARKSRRLARLVASNLRRLKNDNYIKPNYDNYKVFHDIVFGTQEYLGTTDDFRIDIIKLPKISKAAANGLFALIPAKDFPELEGIDDWAKLPLDRVTEDFLARLESYF